MELWQVAILLFLIWLAFDKRYEWLYMLNGSATAVIAVDITDTDLKYGLPLVGLGICMVFAGLFQIARERR